MAQQGQRYGLSGPPETDSAGVLDELTSRQQAVLQYIVDYVDRHGAFPPPSEIARAQQVRSPGGIRRILSVLEEKGFIETTTPPGSSRKGRKLTRRAQILSANSWPLVGIVPAGSLNLAIQTAHRHLSSVADIVPDMSGEDRVMRVESDSMTERGILPGDYVVIRPTADFTPHDICVVRLRHGKPTLHFVHDNGSRYSLRSANPGWRPVECGPDEVTVIGRVIAHIGTTQFRV